MGTYFQAAWLARSMDGWADGPARREREGSECLAGLGMIGALVYHFLKGPFTLV